MEHHNACGVARQGARPSQSGPLRRLSIHALLEGQRLTEPTFASDGRLAFTVSSSYTRPGEDPRTQIWVVTPDKSAEQVTDAGNNSLPRWSPDGRQLAFVSKTAPAGGVAVHILTLETGSVTEYRDLGGRIADIAWSPDNQELLVLATDAEPGQAGAGEAPNGDSASGRPDPQVQRPTLPWRRLFRLEIATRRSCAVGPADLSVWEFDWRGGDTVAAVTSPDPSENGWYTALIAAIDLRTGVAAVAYTPRWQVSTPRLSPDERRIAFIEGICSDRGGAGGTLTTVELASNVDSDDPQSAGPTEFVAELTVSGLGWRDDARLWYSGCLGMRASCGSVSIESGVHEESWNGRAVLREVSASADGQCLAAVKETLADPPEVALLELDAAERSWRTLTTINAPLSDLDLPQVEQVHWTAPDGWDIDGLLVRPVQRSVHDRPPLVVLVHGGPTVAWSHAFPCGGGRHAALLADAGYAVLLPNPRGSSGRGQEFAQAIVGDLGGAEFEDTLSGVAACVAAGFADGDRVGIMGASHGGFIAAWAVTQTTRFRAGVAIACVSDYLSLHYTSNIGALDDILFVGKDRVSTYLERSPIAWVDKCETPMLIIHGEQDECCPPGQALELYGGLIENGVETELVMYPREGHGVVEYDHQLDLWERVTGWLDAHLAGRG